MVQNIVLVGPMGAGKTTVGKQLADRLNFEFVDTDHLIEARTGVDIPRIFDIEGEAGFRDRESVVLSGLLGAKEVVIATGGGIVLRQENHAVLRQLGSVFYLCASLKQLLDRTSKDKKRPLLQVANPEQKIKELVEQRDPLYRSVADRVINTSDHSSKSIIANILESL